MLENPKTPCVDERKDWWTHLDSNQGPLACEASALTGLSYASTASLELSRRGHGAASPTSLLRNFGIFRVAPARTASSGRGASSPEITKRWATVSLLCRFTKLLALPRQALGSHGPAER